MNDLVEKFKAAWHEADAEGDVGNRVKRGLDAVLADYHAREMHHFETEESLTQIKNYVERLEDWEIEDHARLDILELIPEDI